MEIYIQQNSVHHIVLFIIMTLLQITNILRYTYMNKHKDNGNKLQIIYIVTKLGCLCDRSFKR